MDITCNNECERERQERVQSSNENELEILLHTYRR